MAGFMLGESTAIVIVCISPSGMPTSRTAIKKLTGLGSDGTPIVSIPAPTIVPSPLFPSKYRQGITQSTLNYLGG
jgi:hypothetical protein